MPKKLWSKERVVAELKQHRQDGPRMHPQLDAAARRHFGSVREALRVAGLPCGKRQPPYFEWSQELVIQAIRQRHENGKCLDCTNQEAPSLYSAGKRLFGNWTAARAAAGFPRPPREYYSADEVQLRIIDLYERESPLTYRSHNDEKLKRSAKKHFGGWGLAVQSLGLGSELRRTWCKQTVVEAILHRRASGLSLYATHHEDKGLFCAAVKLFGNWHNALQACGIEARVRERWSEEKVVERLREHAKTQPLANIRKVDTNLAYAAARRFGSIRKAMEAAGLATMQSNPRKPR